MKNKDHRGEEEDWWCPTCRRWLTDHFKEDPRKGETYDGSEGVTCIYCNELCDFNGPEKEHKQ